MKLKMKSYEEILAGSVLKTRGFPVCKKDNKGCVGYRWEATDGKLCRSCGGPFPTEDQLRRILLRQLLGCYRELCELRYSAPEVAGREVAYFQGAAYAIGGIMDQLGFHEDAKPIMDELFEKGEMG